MSNICFLTVSFSLMSNTAALIRTVICSWRSVSFARTVTLAYGPWFAVDSPYASHGPSFLLTDRYLRLTVRTFRTDRHPCLQTVIYDSRSVCRGINSPSHTSMIEPRYLTVRTKRARYTKEVKREDGNMSITRSISVAQTDNRVVKANCYVHYSFYWSLVKLFKLCHVI